MKPLNRCIAGIDVHKKMLAVVVRKQNGERVEYVQRQFGTVRRELEHLVAWLQHEGVSAVVMESTAQYWRPVWYMLEGHFQLHLTHPLKTKAPRGRKRDFRDARRLADRWESGDLEESFIPAAEQRAWRFLTRSRVHAKRKIGVIRCQIEGLLEQGGIKISSVITDLFGASGWAMLENLADGNHDVEKLVELAQGVLRKKTAQLKEALAGRLDLIYQMLLRQHLELVALLRKQIEELNQALSTAMKDHVAVLCRLSKMPGVDLHAAQELLAEIGPGATAFPSADQFVSWVGVCPGSQESAGVNYSHRSPKGNRYLRRLLMQTAWAAIHTKNTFYASLFQRMKPKLAAKGAAWAVAHRMARVIWLIMHEEVEYKEQGQAKPRPETLARKFRKLVREFKSQGIDVRALFEKTLEAHA
jgi:transposase